MIKRASTGAFGAAERGEQVSQRFCKALRHPIALQQPQVRARFVVVATSSDARTAQAPVPPSQVEMLAAPRGPANMSTSAHISWGKHYRMIWHSLSDGSGQYKACIMDLLASERNGGWVIVQIMVFAVLDVSTDV